MEVLLLILGIAALLGGLAGAVLPIPGPPLSFLGLLLLNWSTFVDFSIYTLVSFGVITVIITVLDYYIPIWGVKQFGGTKYGSWGSILGLLIGFFFPIPGGIFLGAFLGALIGELIGGMKVGKATKAAIGSFLGFLAGMFMQIILCLAMIVYAGYAIFSFERLSQ